MTDTLARAATQGIVARGYSGLGHARFTLFACDDQPAARALLAWLLPRITSAARKFSADTAAQVAFTPAGLHRLGPPEQAGGPVPAALPGAVAGAPPRCVPGRHGPSPAA